MPILSLPYPQFSGYGPHCHLRSRSFPVRAISGYVWGSDVEQFHKSSTYQGLVLPYVQRRSQQPAFLQGLYQGPFLHHFAPGTVYKYLMSFHLVKDSLIEKVKSTFVKGYVKGDDITSRYHFL